MSIFDDLTSPRSTEPEAQRRPAAPAPKGWEPGVAYAPTGGMTVTTTATHLAAHGDEKAWHALVEDLGISVPPGWRVRLVEAKYDPVAWTRETPEQDKATTQPVWRYRFAVEPAVAGLDIGELVQSVKRRKAAPAERPTGTAAYVIAMGDTQIGKMDGDGPEGTIDRILASVEGQKKRLKELRRLGRPVGDVYALWLGDCIEGFVSQGGGNAWRTQMTLTEQVRVVRRLMLHQIEELAPLADHVVLASIPGNHDEAVRFGKGITRYDDSWAVEAAVQVGDALELNKAAFGHVSIVVPGRDELTLTLDIAGTRVGLAHGHQFRPGKAQTWWAEQAHGLQPIGDATLLLTAHLHHLQVMQGGAKTHVQVPAFEGESTWWRHSHGQVAPSGAVTLVVGNGGWSDLAVV